MSTPICASRCHSGSSWARAVCASAHSRSASSGRARAPAQSQQRLRERLGVGGHGHRLRPRAHARELGRDRAAAQAGVLEDPVGQGGVVERLDLERHDADVGAQDQPRGRLVLARARATRGSAPRGRRRSPGRRAHSSSCHAPTSSSTSRSPSRSLTARSSAQSVRQPRWPSEIATTSPPGRGAGNESAASGTVIARAPGVALEPRELVGGGEIVDARSAACSCSASRRSRMLRVGVVGALVAIPAPVPQLAAGAQRR